MANSPLHTVSRAISRTSSGVSSSQDAASVTSDTRVARGSSRRARRAQKVRSDTVPVRRTSASSRPVMRNPDSTKNTSTPT